MSITEVIYPDGIVKICMDAVLEDISAFHEKEKTVIITDENVFSFHQKKFEGYHVIKITGGEKNKTQASVDRIIEELLEMDADKTWLIAGVGGGVVTDMAGYAASIYKRGVKLGLIPTSILSMTDAAIGGKNGVNVGIYKNMVGTTWRPYFILYDQRFLESLPRKEWINGFAEIIKHACIKDAAMFEELEQHDIDYYMNNKYATAELIEKNVSIKNAIVVNDEAEAGERFLLNFGHTVGHAIENLHNLSHGQAISIGMAVATSISEKINDLDTASKQRILSLLQQYGLPVSLITHNTNGVIELIRKDKKRLGDKINFVLLDCIGQGVVKPLTFPEVGRLLDQII